MAVRNVRGLGRTKPIQIYHAIPPASSAIWKVTIDIGSSELDVSDLIMSAKFNGGTTKTIGNFELRILDPQKTIYNQIDLFDDIYFYGDYGTTASSKRLRYKLETKGYEDDKTVISGLGILMIFSEKKIIYQTIDSEGNFITKGKSTIITEIIQANFPDITDFSEIETNSDAVQKNYSEIPFMDIINDICGSTHEFYLDHNLVPHYFTRGSIQSSVEAISEEVNYLGADENTSDAEEIFSRVRVYGAFLEGLQIIATSESDTSLTGGIQKDKVIKNTSIETTTQAQELADSEFLNIKNPPRIGSFNSLLLPSLNPGEKLFIAIPTEDVSPGYYQIQEFTHIFDLSVSAGFKTKVIMEKRRISLPKIMGEVGEFTEEATAKDNPHDMSFSQVITFKEDSGTHTNTELSDGYLKVVSGASSGNWLSEVFELDENVSAIEFLWTGESLVTETSVKTSQIFYSLDGGTTFSENLVLGSETSVISGKDIQLKLVLNDPLAKVKAVAFRYKF